jgi:hypothetical protein
MKTSFVIASDALRPDVATRFRAGFTVATPAAKCYFFDSYSLAEDTRPNSVAVSQALFFAA